MKLSGPAVRSLMLRWLPWAMVAALVLRSGIPMLAAAAAQLSGVPVAEVCDVYGVAPPAMASHGHAMHAHLQREASRHGAHSAAEHSTDHCALTALGALASASVAELQAPQAARRSCRDVGPVFDGGWHDACARWAARLEHGPPDASS